MDDRLFRMQMKAGKSGERIAEWALAQGIVTSDVEYAGKQFNQLLIGDLIVVHKASFPIALVRVSSKVPDEEVSEEGFGVDYRIKVLSWYEELPQEAKDDIGLWGSFPFTGTFFRLNKGNSTYDAVDRWHQVIVQKLNMTEHISLLERKHQIILQGPPGTGKTRAAEEIAFQMVFRRALRLDSNGRNEDLKQLEQSGQYKFVQFHPAYSYEDFVRSISAKTEGGQLSYEVENRTLATFAKKAKEEWDAGRRTPVENARRAQVRSWLENWRAALEERVADNQPVQLTPGTRITRITDDGIRYDGNNGWKVDNGVPFGDVVEMYIANVGSREEIKTLPGLAQSAKTSSTYWWYMVEVFRAYLQETDIDQTPTTDQKPDSPKAFVLVIDEINRANLPAVLGELIYALEYRGREVTSLYSHPIDGPELVLPPNLFLIGTMNTADRSVGHIDYAIRRRFAFVDVLPEIGVVPAGARPLFDAVQKLFTEKEGSGFKFLSSEFNPESVALGHSYFLDADPNYLRMRWRYEIKPILKEYIRDGILLESACAELDKIEQTIPANNE